MKLWTRILPMLAFVAVLIGLGARPASAAELTQTADQDAPNMLAQYGIGCEEGVCTVEVPLDSLNLSPLTILGADYAIDVMQENMKVLPDGVSLELEDNLVVNLPLGKIKLVDADLTMTMNDAQEIEQLRGTAQVPFPTLGIFENVTVNSPLRADVGMDYGKNLADLHAPLDAERRYMFINFGAGLAMEAERLTADGDTRQLAISVPKGQQATLIIDTVEPYAYLAGNATLSYDEQLAFVGQLFNAEELATLLDGMPIRHRIGLEVISSVGRGQENFLRLGGNYTMDAGLVGRWLGVNLTPLSTQGVVVFSSGGLLLDGLAQTELFPETLLDADLRTQVFVPFDTSWEEAYVQIDANAAVPMLGTTMDATARLHGSEGILATASISSPVYDNEGLALIEADGDQAPRLGFVRTAADSAANQATRSFIFVRNAGGNGANWVADGVGGSWSWTQNTWCGVTGFCGNEELPAEVAIATE